MRSRGTAVCALAALFAVPGIAHAKSDSIETAGQAIAIALPVAAGGFTIAEDDWSGLAQLTATTGATVGTAFLLKYAVPEERPDHSNKQSFPSDTAALAFAPANFLWDRYGWRYGLPAYLAAGFVGYSRVESKQHHWWDVAASAGLAFGYNRLFTRRLSHAYDINTDAALTPHSAFVSVNFNW
jgi:membrane-associated phospholipid phosphatase